jgi:tRNA A37 threonylcarbamoyladenosine dehydratase
MRKELRRKGVHNLKVVFSKEEARTPIETEETSCNEGCVCPKGSQENVQAEETFREVLLMFLPM